MGSDLGSPMLTSDEARELAAELNEAVGIERLLEIERGTVELGEG